MSAKIRWAILMITLVACAPTAFAHGGGHEPIPASAAMEVAGMVAGKLADADLGLGFGKLDKSWKQIPPEAISVRKKGRGYYIVEVVNAAEKRTLSVLMSPAGEVYDANFTGQFPGLSD